ncbi:MAG: hypothetical protein MUP53_00540 [Bacteroidales bacterium]|nr:hypothetical protein [Bacteroidales bacterium]
MDGYGLVADLPVELDRKIDNVMIFHGNSAGDNTETDGRGIWSVLEPGHGAGFRSDGITNSYSDRFGVELSLALRLSHMSRGENIAIIKYSRGGTSIDTSAAGQAGCWMPDYRGGNGINQYDHFLATVKTAMSSSDIVRKAQADFVAADGKAELVTSTDEYGYSDPWHYNSEGFIDLGNKFAEALMRLK